MLKVGLTGGLASGKTLVGEVLAGGGWLVIEADELGHEALAPGGEAYDAVAREFIGHDSPTVSKQYTHIPTDTLRQAANKLPDIFK